MNSKPLQIEMVSMFLKTIKKSFVDGRDSQKAYDKYSGKEDL